MSERVRHIASCLAYDLQLTFDRKVHHSVVIQFPVLIPLTGIEAALTDFFISYTSADRQWAEWIAWQLEEASYSVVIQAWDIQPGHDFVAEMDRASREAERTLAVLTPKYFQSRFTQAEWSPAFAKGNLLAVRVADFDVEGLLSVRVYIDLAGKDETQAKDALLTGH